MPTLALTSRSFEYAEKVVTPVASFSSNSTVYVDVTSMTLVSKAGHNVRCITYIRLNAVSGTGTIAVRDSLGNVLATATTTDNVSTKKILKFVMPTNDTIKLSIKHDTGATQTFVSANLEKMEMYTAPLTNLSDINQKMRVTGFALKATATTTSLNGVLSDKDVSNFALQTITNGVVMDRFIFDNNDGETLFDWQGDYIGVQS